MRAKFRLRWASAWYMAAMAGAPAWATFHLMKIEQVIGGVNGDSSAQAIQLRMRLGGQGKLAPSRLVAYDARGENPVVLIDFSEAVANEEAGARILVASPNMALYASPGFAPDFTLVNLIPEAYLAAGSLTFETDSGGLIVFRLSWGGSGYSGATTGSADNDDDGEYGPAVSEPLPHEGLGALLCQARFDALATTNLAEFAMTAGAGLLTSNAGTEFTVGPCSATSDTDGDGICDLADNCPQSANADQSDRDEDGVGDACDGCPDDAEKTSPGTCGCGVADDADGDGRADCEQDTAGGATDDLPPNGSNCGCAGLTAGAALTLTMLRLWSSRSRRRVGCQQPR